MATFKNYQPRSEGLNAAYEMLLQAELAKAQAMGNAFAPLTDAIRSGQQMKIARDEQARLKNAQAAETDYRNKSIGLDTRRLDLQEKEFNTKQASNEAYDAYMRSLLHGPAPSQPAATGIPFTGGGSAAMTQRPPLSAGGLLGQTQQPQGMPEPPPGMFTPEQWSNINGAINTMHDNEAQDRKYQQEQALKQQADQAFNSELAAAVAGKIPGVSEDKGARIRARYLVDPKQATEELQKAQDAHLDRLSAQRTAKAAVKDLRTAIQPNDPEADYKNRLLDGLELQVKSLNDIDPKVITKNIEDARGYVLGVDTTARTQRKSESDKQAEAEAKSPFKYLAGDKEFQKGGFINKASPELQAKVKLQAMALAAGAGDLRDASLMLQTANPTYAQIKDFYGQMDAAEQAAIANYEKVIWATNGWKPEVIADQSVPTDSSLVTEQTGVPFPAPNNFGPSSDPMAPVPGIPSQPSPMAGPMSTPPDVRTAMAEAMRAGKSKEEIRAIYEQGKKAADMAGSVTTKPVEPTMREKSMAFLVKNRLSSLPQEDVTRLFAIGSRPKQLREFLRARGFKEGNVLDQTIEEVMRHINTFKDKPK